MSKYVTGMKRNQIIQRWLQGIDDEQYEVFPTKKEGKYIVKLRTQPLIRRDKSSDNLNGMVESTNDNSNAHPSVHSNAHPSDDSNDESPSQDETQPTPKRQPSKAGQRSTQRTMSTPTQQVAPHDSTVNLEILEQLRSLGEELRNDRFKREQKQYIKHVVNKELSKPRIRSKYVPDLFPTDDQPPPHEEKQSNQPPEPIPEIIEQPTNIIEQQPQFRSRIRR